MLIFNHCNQFLGFEASIATFHIFFLCSVFKLHISEVFTWLAVANPTSTLVVSILLAQARQVKKAKTSETCSLRTEHRKKMRNVAMDASNPIETDYSD